MAVFGIGSEFGLFAACRRAGNIARCRLQGKLRINRRFILFAKRRGQCVLQKALAGVFAQEQIAAHVHACRQQSMQYMMILPQRGRGGQPERRSVLPRPRAPQIALRAHIVKPPRQPLAVQSAPLRLHHHKAFGTHGNKFAQMLQPARSIHAVHGNIGQAAPVITQGVVNGFSRADAHHVIAHRVQDARQGRLANSCYFRELRGIGNAAVQALAEDVGVFGHGS